ncbi:MAG: efflux RND transporter periplasmic adaptor subunit [Bacteroidetes bacterium]|nr:efflux RND transporter periplasmic adaptor subunit [Bacteroidota bacterium]
MSLLQRFYRLTFEILLLFLPAAIIQSCHSSETKTEQPQHLTQTPELPVITIRNDSAVTYKEYTASLEGKVNVEIRAQVDGYLNKIFVDEGSYVKTGQSLFKIDDHTYLEQLNTALANLHAAEATMNNAQIEVDKLTPLVKNNVISEIQLKTAQTNYNGAKASVELAKAAIASARINVDFTLIKAPVNGYIGRIPKRIGNLVSKNDQTGLTTLSDIDQVYAYFSMSESEFLRFHEQSPGISLEKTIDQLPALSLVMADGLVYQHKGKLDLVNGQFDKSTGAITLRATFPNPEKLLRSGNTGKIRMEEHQSSVILVPISATIDQQEKTFVYVLGDSNKVKRKAINISGKSGNNYIVKDGVSVGDKIVTEGFETLNEGSAIIPQQSKQ